MGLHETDLTGQPAASASNLAGTALDRLPAAPVAEDEHASDIAKIVPPMSLMDAPVTRPSMPPMEEFLPYVEKIWSNRWLTNAGPFHQQLEDELAAYLGVEHVALTSNGTSALQLALQALDLGGEVITTPFTFVATTHAIRLTNLRPVFVDIDPRTGNLDPDAVEAAITNRTRAIMPVHCFGFPCDTDRIGELADIYGLKVIYDAAHAFGVQRGGKSILREGDASCLSFHATKVFNTFEGGAVICSDLRLKNRIARLRNFGFAGHFTVVAPGTNAKMSELHAAFGLLQLKYVDDMIAKRGEIVAKYRAGLAGLEGVRLFEMEPDWKNNHAYFPFILEGALADHRDEICTRLLAAGIHARPYFFPLISDHASYRDLPSAKGELPVARSFARQILCLPLYPDLAHHHIDNAVEIIGGFQRVVYGGGSPAIS